MATSSRPISWEGFTINKVGYSFRNGQGERDLMKRAKVSHHTLGAARSGVPIDTATLRRIAAATVALRENFLRLKSEAEELLDWAREAVIDLGGRSAFAKLLGVSGP